MDRPPDIVDILCNCGLKVAAVDTWVERTFRNLTGTITTGKLGLLVTNGTLTFRNKKHTDVLDPSLAAVVGEFDVCGPTPVVNQFVAYPGRMADVILNVKLPDGTKDHTVLLRGVDLLSANAQVDGQGMSPVQSVRFKAMSAE